MLSIGQFAKSAKVSARTLRYYESIGLLPASVRGENNYRFYDQQWLQTVHRIRDLQSLGFSLEDIKTIINFSNTELTNHLKAKLLEIDLEAINLESRKERITNLLSVANKIETGKPLTETERNLYMENIKDEIISGLKSRYAQVNDSTLAYLNRDGLNQHAQIGEFIDAVKKCIQFAKNKNLILGPIRGSASASLSLFGLGISQVDPLKYEMVPERLSSQTPIFHLDVEYDRGQEFVDFCRHINDSLDFGEIQAFKMPLIDIVQNTHKAIGKNIDYDSIDDNADAVLNPFRQLDFDRIFQFDFTDDSLVMGFEKFKPEYLGLDKVIEHFKDQKEFNFRDIINFTALWRPSRNEIIERIDLYRQAKAKPFSYGFLSDKIEKWLKPNYGIIIYHEDIMKIISEYTGWNLARSNELRRLCLVKSKPEKREQSADWIEFNRIVPKEVVDLTVEESKWAFCMPHAVSFAKFTKQTAVLKSLHKDIYYSEIERFEQKYGFRWDDIGIRIDGVSLHQG